MSNSVEITSGLAELAERVEAGIAACVLGPTGVSLFELHPKTSVDKAKLINALARFERTRMSKVPYLTTQQRLALFRAWRAAKRIDISSQ